MKRHSACGCHRKCVVKKRADLWMHYGKAFRYYEQLDNCFLDIHLMILS